jgi:hypothetical protein
MLIDNILEFSHEFNMGIKKWIMRNDSIYFLSYP